MKPIVYVIGGPTASGKSKLAVELAKKVNGEIISADSMQIYKEMNIGTAKVNKEEMQGVQHYLVDFVSPDERYSVSNFKKDAEKAIEEILEKGKTSYTFTELPKYDSEGNEYIYTAQELSLIHISEPTRH